MNRAARHPCPPHFGRQRATAALDAGTPAQAGFTLLEVLVALAIIGVALAAAVRAVGTATTASGILQTRALALLAADTHMGELMVAGAAAGGPARPCAQQGRPFLCVTRIEPAEAGMNAVIVEVYLQDQPDRALATLATLQKR
ncbi:type II secretion system minor pseudopilin GspI [Orrella sp. JC864]|uniref:type II secretion system minor pseudopilin GspI n=1 Tax=Orrella sp. JC864 TaxID=3120298 RepID=UPI00300A6608